jgi:hypothetical protein
MYARLKEGALDTLARSQEFTRGAENTVFHQGYPINYRQQGGLPSIQISVALEGRRAESTWTTGLRASPRRCSTAI